MMGICECARVHYCSVLRDSGRVRRGVSYRCGRRLCGGRGCLCCCCGRLGCGGRSGLGTEPERVTPGSGSAMGVGELRYSLGSKV